MTDSLKGIPVVLAVDIGTTSVKTLLVDKDGKVRSSYSVEYPLNTPKPGYAEQDPEEIYRAVLRAVASVIRMSGSRPQDILCASFSAAMHSLMALDKEGAPLTPCITFADNRSAGYVRILKDEYDGHRIFERTGTPLHPMSPLLKLMWMKNHQPELFGRAHKFVGIKEYVLSRLFRDDVVDVSLASATGLFNLKNMEWDEGAMQAAGVDAERLSRPVPVTHRLGGLDTATAAELGLRPDTPFVVGASDGVLANLGIGAIDPGVYAVTIGTSGAVRGVITEPTTDREGRLFCYALKEDFWVTGGAINNGGIMLRWVRDCLATLEAEEARRLNKDPYNYLSLLAEQVPAGSEGLIFHPLLSGERAPYWNANARGMFFGLALHHDKRHMIRAVMEGVMYRIHSVAQALAETGTPPKEIRASGGFARSPLWRQILADVMGTPVSIPASIESSGLGAAQVGLLAINEIGGLADCAHWIESGERHEVNHANHAVYAKLTPIFIQVYHQLKDQFDAIAEYQNQIKEA